jgi:hypothetical protein
LIAQVPQMAVEIMRELARRVDRTTERYRLAVAGDEGGSGAAEPVDA